MEGVQEGNTFESRLGKVELDLSSIRVILFVWTMILLLGVEILWQTFVLIANYQLMGLNRRPPRLWVRWVVFGPSVVQPFKRPKSLAELPAASWAVRVQPNGGRHRVKLLLLHRDGDAYIGNPYINEDFSGP